MDVNIAEAEVVADRATRETEVLVEWFCQRPTDVQCAVERRARRRRSPPYPPRPGKYSAQSR